MRWLVGVIALSLAACAPLPGEPGSLSEAYTQQCTTGTPLEGVDVYSGTGVVDWTSLQASGRSFTFIKASQGNYDTDSKFASNWTNANAAGLVRSPYHFFDGTVDGATQAQYFLDILTANGGLADTDLPPMLDIECPTSSVEADASQMCVGSGAGDSGWVDSATLLQGILDWLNTVEAATGRKAILYSYPSWFASVAVTDPALAAYPLYIASYNACASVPAPWTSAVFWQYTATGTAPGIAGNADLDRFFGGASELQQFITGGETMDAGSGTDAASAADLSNLTLDFAGTSPPDDQGHTGGSAHGGCHCELGVGRAHTPIPVGVWFLVLAAVVVARMRARAS